MTFFQKSYLLMSATLFCSSLVAAELTVVASPIRTTTGEIGCAIYSSANGFPMESSKAIKSQWIPTKGEAVRCRFTDLPSGQYAVAISLDENGNRKTDTNFLGMPREAWGVSNNVRPSLRPPTFDEAMIRIEANKSYEINVELRK